MLHAHAAGLIIPVRHKPITLEQVAVKLKRVESQRGVLYNPNILSARNALG